jgi:hypothetical protein
LFAAESISHLRFIDTTSAWKIDFKHDNSPTPSKHLLEAMSGGVALLDYDNDGRLDIFLTNGARIDESMMGGKLPDKSDPRFWNRLYHQNADGTFTEVAEKAGVTGKAQNHYNNGVAVGDFDNDGFVDLYVTGFGANTLYRNRGDGTFADVTETAQAAASGWSTSAGFFDYDNDGRLDLFICRYATWSFENDRYCGEKKVGGRAYCHPDVFPGIANVLLHNNGDGTFTDVSGKAGIANPKGKGLGVSFGDFDNDGWTDVYVANDAVQCFLYRNNHNGTFTDVSLSAGVGYNEDGKTFSGMGTDFADYDNDGLPDIVVTDLSDERYVLFRNNGDGSFTDMINQSGLGRATLPYSGWSTRFIDADNDGWKDLFVAQGHVMDNIEVTSPNLRYLQPPLLLRNQKGQFSKVDAGPTFSTQFAGRGAAFGDIDNDGFIDVVVANLGQRAYVLRNASDHSAHWLGLAVQGRKSNRDGIGVKVKVVAASGFTQHYSVTTTVGYQSASDKRLVIGLGDSTTARLIELRWPSGIVQRLENVPAGKLLKIVEPEK